MQADYIRRDVPAEISEEGGAFIQIVGKTTVGLAESIKESLDGLHVVGSPTMIEGYFKGLMRSVFEGIAADGHPRSVGDITFYPTPGGTFDLERGWNPLFNDVRVKARLANGITLDVSGWTFRDVTPGRQAFSIESVSDGTTPGAVTVGSGAELNGRNFPAKALLRIEWTCGLKSGTVEAAKFTSNVSRINIASDGLTGLTNDDAGKAIVFAVKGCYNKASKTAMVLAGATLPTVTNAQTPGKSANTVVFGDETPWYITGTGFQSGDHVTIELYNPDTGALWDSGDLTSKGKVTSLTATRIDLDGIRSDGARPDGDWINQYPRSKIVIVRGTSRVEYPVTFTGS